ncbi:hypothetical protein TNCV_528381 [Trichonephila clavipes]|nr:hypothetical protein TNCV_528381 [Trichonephila clavipes]
MWEEGIEFQCGLGKDVWGIVERYLKGDLDVVSHYGGIEKLLWEQVGNKNVSGWEKMIKRTSDEWGHFKWNVPIHVTGWKFLNCVIPFHPRYEETEEWTPLLYALVRRNSTLAKRSDPCNFNRVPIGQGCHTVGCHLEWHGTLESKWCHLEWHGTLESK